MAKPSSLTLTQATEWGTVYTVDEIAHLCHEAHSYGLKTHMDGARFANALVHLNVPPADLTWRAGIDILSFGATKNGAMQAEAIVVFDSSLAEELDYQTKRAGQLPAKQRYWAAQFISYFDNNLWLELAEHANAMAQKLAKTLCQHQMELIVTPQANEIFVKLPTDVAEYLQNKGAHFYPWGSKDHFCYRMVTSWMTQEEEISSLENHLNNY
jgi:threonine aldolase